MLANPHCSTGSLASAGRLSKTSRARPATASTAPPNGAASSSRLSIPLDCLTKTRSNTQSTAEIIKHTREQVASAIAEADVILFLVDVKIGHDRRRLRGRRFAPPHRQAHDSRRQQGRFDRAQRRLGGVLQPRSRRAISRFLPITVPEPAICSTGSSSPYLKLKRKRKLTVRASRSPDAQMSAKADC